MSNDQPISRRDALMAATVLGAVAAVGQADDDQAFGNGFKPSLGERLKANDEDTQKSKAESSLKLQLTMTDGQVVTFNANQAVITFGGGGALVATSAGILPFNNAQIGALSVNPNSVPTSLSPARTAPIEDDENFGTGDR